MFIMLKSIDGKDVRVNISEIAYYYGETIGLAGPVTLLKLKNSKIFYITQDAEYIDKCIKELTDKA